MSEGPKKPKYSATRRLQLKVALLRKAAAMLVAEDEQRIHDRERVVNENHPPLQLSGLSPNDLQELCKELHRKIDVVDEARYDMETKATKYSKEIETLNHKIVELKGVKRPNLKRVKKTADERVGAYADQSKLKKSDFKANLKTVKKDEDKKEEVTDWRKNVEAMSGMEGRKKLFNAGQ